MNAWKAYDLKQAFEGVLRRNDDLRLRSARRKARTGLAQRLRRFRELAEKELGIRFDSRRGVQRHSDCRFAAMTAAWLIFRDENDMKTCAIHRAIGDAFLRDRTMVPHALKQAKKRPEIADLAWQLQRAYFDKIEQKGRR